MARIAVRLGINVQVRVTLPTSREGSLVNLFDGVVWKTRGEALRRTLFALGPVGIEPTTSRL